MHIGNYIFITKLSVIHAGYRATKAKNIYMTYVDIIDWGQKKYALL